MSTRCNIVVQSSISGQNILYKHCDGYPDGGIGDSLKKLLDYYTKNIEEYDYVSLTNSILLTYDDIIKDEKVAKDISYVYKIIVYTHTIFYTCYKVPVCGDYDIGNIDDEKDCSIIDSKEFNTYTSEPINESNINNAECVIDDTKTLLEYTNTRNYFIDQLITKYKNSDKFDKKDIKLITELLKLSYDQGYNYKRLDNI